MGRLEIIEYINWLLTHSTEEERTVLEMKFGLNGKRPMTFKEIAKTLGKNSYQVPERTVKRAVKRLRKVRRRNGDL